MIKSAKVIKFKVVNTNIDKKFIGKDLDLQKVRTKDSPTTKPRAKAPAWFASFRDEVIQRFDRQDKRFNRLENRIDGIVNVNNLKE